MIIELEQQFFKVFGIEPFIYCSKPRLDCPARKVGTCTKECEYYSGLLYPEITAEKLLELICIYLMNVQMIYSGSFNKDTLKNFILQELVALYNDTKNVNKKLRIRQQVRSLFEEGE